MLGDRALHGCRRLVFSVQQQTTNKQKVTIFNGAIAEQQYYTVLCLLLASRITPQVYIFFKLKNSVISIAIRNLKAALRI